MTCIPSGTTMKWKTLPLNQSYFSLNFLFMLWFNRNTYLPYRFILCNYMNVHRTLTHWMSKFIWNTHSNWIVTSNIQSDVKKKKFHHDSNFKAWENWKIFHNFVTSIISIELSFVFLFKNNYSIFLWNLKFTDTVLNFKFNFFIDPIQKLATQMYKLI